MRKADRIRYRVCPVCHGHGCGLSDTSPDAVLVDCSACGGRGKISRDDIPTGKLFKTPKSA